MAQKSPLPTVPPAPLLLLQYEDVYEPLEDRTFHYIKLIDMVTGRGRGMTSAYAISVKTLTLPDTVPWLHYTGRGRGMTSA